jgi:hypothetical protein
MTLIGLASKLAIKSRIDSIKDDLKHLSDMLKLAKKLVSQMAGADFVADIQAEIKHLKATIKEVVKNFEGGAKLTYTNTEGDVYKCEMVWDCEEFTEILYWVPYMERFELRCITDKSQIV